MLSVDTLCFRYIILHVWTQVIQQTAVTAHFSCEQLLLFAIAVQWRSQQIGYLIADIHAYFYGKLMSRSMVSDMCVFIMLSLSIYLSLQNWIRRKRLQNVNILACKVSTVSRWSYMVTFSAKLFCRPLMPGMKLIGTLPMDLA